jgi:hypothetical protein
MDEMSLNRTGTPKYTKLKKTQQKGFGHFILDTLVKRISEPGKMEVQFS